MYAVKLVYDPEPRTQTLKESITYCASVDLFLRYHIDCCQCSASVLLFESERDRLIALIALSESKSFTALVWDKEPYFD
jgi:hypothetical protein